MNYMKKIGLVGGTSWVSTIEYYRFINEMVNEKLGGNEYATCIIHSLNHGEIKRNQDNNDWQATLRLLTAAADNMKAGGAEAIVLCANTMHIMADEVQQHVGLPVIHIAEATARAIRAKGLTKVGLLGTRFTMEKDFYKNKLAEAGITCAVPGEAARDFIHNSIISELAKGNFSEQTRAEYVKIMEQLVQEGCEGIILGCTEIPLLVHQEDCSVPVFDTTFIHSQAAVAFMLS